MAKITEPYEGFNFARNYGKVLMFQQQKRGTISRQYVPGKIRTEKPKQYGSLISKYLNQKWKTLSQQEKEIYENIGKKYLISAYELFITEGFKELFGTKYAQGRYNCTRYAR